MHYWWLINLITFKWKDKSHSIHWSITEELNRANPLQYSTDSILLVSIRVRQLFTWVTSSDPSSRVLFATHPPSLRPLFRAIFSFFCPNEFNRIRGEPVRMNKGRKLQRAPGEPRLKSQDAAGSWHSRPDPIRHVFHWIEYTNVPKKIKTNSYTIENRWERPLL